jgi:hypothetical protein
MSADEMQQLKPTRASFIRSLPLTMPVDEVIERGREIGISIQPSDVHSTRYYMRQEADARMSAVSTSSEVARVIRPLVFQTPGVQVVPKLDAPVEKPGEVRAEARARKGRTEKPDVRKPPLSIADVERDLRAIVLRLGSDRVRSMIETIEETTLRTVLGRRS